MKYNSLVYYLKETLDILPIIVQHAVTSKLFIYVLKKSEISNKGLSISKASNIYDILLN